MHEWEEFMQYPDPLHWAAGKGDLSAVEQFIGHLNNAPEIKADCVNKDSKMPVHYAAVSFFRVWTERGLHTMLW